MPDKTLECVDAEPNIRNGWRCLRAPRAENPDNLAGQTQRHLLPALILLVAILVAGGSTLLYLQQQRHLAKNVASDIAAVVSGLGKALDQETAALAAIGQPIAASPEVQQALAAGDAERLRAAWSPLFAQLRQLKGLTHMYFLDANRICLLRVHQPQQRGDQVNRFTALEAERTGMRAGGLEIGPLGTFTLRMVQPVFAGSRRVGFIELGVEMETVLRSLHLQPTTQLLLLLRKAALQQDGWQEGLRLMGRDAPRWENMAENVVSYTTLPSLPAEIVTWADTFASTQGHGSRNQEIAAGGKAWRVGATSMRDASGQGVGELLILRDITADRALSRDTLLLVGAVTVALLLLSWIVLSSLLRRVDSRIKAEQAKLVASEQSYRSQFAENSSIMLLFDPVNGAILDGNSAAQHFYGYSREQLLTLRIGDINIMPPNELQLIGEAVMTGSSRQFELQHRLADGSLRDVRVSLSSIASGGRTLLHSIVNDISAERKGQEARRLLDAVIEQTGEGIVVASLDGIIKYVNPAELENSGCSEKELIGTRLQVFTNGLTEASVIAELREALAKGQIWFGRLKSRRKDTSIREEEVTISPIRNQDGAVTHYVFIKRDITEMANLQQQLLQAQKLEAIGQLAAGIAHEINTPMQYVQNNVTFFERSFATLKDLLTEVGKTKRSLLTPETTALLAPINLDFLLEEIPESIKETHGGIDRVVEIVAAMKAFSHPGSTDKIASDLNHAVDSTITVCRNEWKYVATMVTDYDPALPLVPCFLDQLHQVVLNLVINAAHAIAAANPAAAETLGQISVATRREGAWAVIQVSDTGCGIPEAIQQRIFDPFFTTKEVGKGTGQGLAIVHDIVVNKHNGQIDFTSKPGQGTTFCIRLPILSA